MKDRVSQDFLMEEGEKKTSSAKTEISDRPLMCRLNDYLFFSNLTSAFVSNCFLFFSFFILF